ncbi:MAG: SCO family protein [Balneolaceae bacterium]|nr:SCO family protein [Balneolaceae bacterium]MBO6545853.1 SCO family protein [Balneolaceae bacterium]MBO6647249.1 SCO family protein [Balneolaceae bacterium]
MKQLLILFFPLVVLINCQSGPEVIDDLSDTSFKLLNQDSVTVTFPDDYQGKYIVMGFIYTNCPDICPLITQNLIKIQRELGYPEDVQFLGVTFDPERDTPSVLADYKEVFKLDENFDFLTGTSETISAFMDSVRVRSQVSLSTITSEGKEIYFMNHSDKIMVLDPKSRVIIEYGGSMPQVPNLIIEDFQSLK